MATQRQSINLGAGTFPLDEMEAALSMRRDAFPFPDKTVSPIRSDFLETATRIISDQAVGVVVSMKAVKHDDPIDEESLTEVDVSQTMRSFEMQTWQFHITTTREAMMDTKQLLGEEASLAQVEGQLLKQFARSYEKRLYELYRSLALKSRAPIKGWAKFLLDTFGVRPMRFIDPNDHLAASRLLMEGKSMVHSNDFRGMADFVVIGKSMMPAVCASAHFVPGRTEEILLHAIHLDTNVDLIGSILGMDIFVVPSNTHTVVFGRRMPRKEGQAFLVEEPWIESNSKDDFTDAISPKLVITMRLRSAIFSVERAERCFASIDVEVSRKPFWRKLIGA